MSNTVFNGFKTSQKLQDRHPEEFYGTPPHATRQLLGMLAKHKVNLGNKAILEPFAGTGLISEVLRSNGMTVYSADFVDRGYRVPANDTTGSTMELRDFFAWEIPYPDFHIISNPPYKRAFEAIKKCLFYTKPGNICAMILNIRFLEGLTRFQWFVQNPPRYVFVFVERCNCAKDADFVNMSEYGGTICYAWFVWEKGYKGLPQLDWIDPKM